MKAKIKRCSGAKIAKIRRAITGAVLGTLMVPMMGIGSHALGYVRKIVGDGYSLKSRFESAYNPTIRNTYKCYGVTYKQNDIFSSKKKKNSLDGVCDQKFPGSFAIYSLHIVFLFGGICAALMLFDETKDVKEKVLEHENQKTK